MCGSKLEPALCGNVTSSPVTFFSFWGASACRKVSLRFQASTHIKGRYRLDKGKKHKYPKKRKACFEFDENDKTTKAESLIIGSSDGELKKR